MMFMLLYYIAGNIQDCEGWCMVELNDPEYYRHAQTRDDFGHAQTRHFGFDSHCLAVSILPHTVKNLLTTAGW